MASTTPVFVATLGGKAQVVTFALDALLQRGQRIVEVIVFHLAPPDPSHRLHRALSQLQAEFAGDRYGGLPCRFRAIPLRNRQHQRLTDLTAPEAVEGAWTTINETIGTLKAQGRELHLGLTGGRRLVAMLAMSVAALHFDINDRIWYLVTPETLKTMAGEGVILHAPPSLPAPTLLDVPIVPGDSFYPGLRAMLFASPAEVIASRRRALDEADRARCEQVWARLTARQREVLACLAHGQSPQEVAEALTITVATVSAHQNAIYAVCRVVWAFPEDEPLDYRWLEQRFGRWAGLPDG